VSGWADILGPGPAPEPLVQDRDADFVVVGGGFAGLAAARRLTQLAPGARIAVLEAGHIAEGASGRNSGFMIDLPHELKSADYAGAGDDRAVIDLNRIGQAFAADAVEEYGIDPNFFDRAGKINGAAGPDAHAQNGSYARHLQSLGEDCRMLDAAQMREITGSGHYVSGLYTPGTIMLQPAGYVRGFAAGLKARGVSFYENSPVAEISRDGGDWLVRAAGATVRTPRVILTVNGHLESFGFARGHLMHLFLFGSMTPELDREMLVRLGGEPRWGITPSNPMGTTMRRIDTGQGGNRIITRSCAALRSGMQATEADMARVERVMQKKFDDRFPALAGLKMEYSWAGHLCLSLNSVSVMKEVDTGIFAGCVQNGLGTVRGTLTGIGAAELACGVESAVTRHFTAEEDPRKLAPQPFRDIGANVILRFKEWQAREE